MKYFTREWCWSELSDEISKDYDLYIENIYKTLPFPLKLLAKKINLHHGIISTVSLSSLDDNLILSGIFGDLENGKVILQANENGLLSLAKHLISLANPEVPANIHIHLDDLNSLESGSSEFIIEKIT